MSSSRTRGAGRSPSLLKDGNKRQRRAIPFWIESLEQRTLLSSDVWQNNDGNNEWSDANNWSEKTIPGPGDDVSVPTGFPTIVYSASVGGTGLTTIDSLSASSPLDFTGGTLTISSTMPIASTITDDLTIEGGGITITGADSSLTASGSVTATSGSLSAEDGATLTLSGLTSLDAFSLSLASQGSGSTLDLSQVTSVTGGGNTLYDQSGGTVLLNSGLTAVSGLTFVVDGTGSTSLLNNLKSITYGGILVGGGTYSLTQLSDVDGSTLDAGNGGTLSLPGVTEVEAPDTYFNAMSAGSTLNISNLGGFFSSNDYISETDGATLLINSGLTYVGGLTITVDGTGNFAPGTTDPLNQFTGIIDGGLTVDGGAYTLTKLSDVHGSTVLVENGGTLSLPSATTLAASYYSTAFDVSGSGSILNVSNLTSFNSYGDYFFSETDDGTLLINSGLSALE